ncbi:MAG: hypothetical protein Q4A67_07340, partial [Aerococcus sp.]|nr:hypothetical protein [Aerococcus sp.]
NCLGESLQIQSLHIWFVFSIQFSKTYLVVIASSSDSSILSEAQVVVKRKFKLFFCRSQQAIFRRLLLPT